MDNALRQAKLAALGEETEAIHSANTRYWNLKAHSHEEDMEYQRRQERLEEVRKAYGRPECLKQEWMDFWTARKMNKAQ